MKSILTQKCKKKKYLTKKPGTYQSVRIYNKLKKIGAKNAELKVVKNDNHFLTSHAFKDEYIYKWLDKNIEGVL